MAEEETPDSKPFILGNQRKKETITTGKGSEETTNVVFTDPIAKKLWNDQTYDFPRKYRRRIVGSEVTREASVPHPPNRTYREDLDAQDETERLARAAASEQRRKEYLKAWETRRTRNRSRSASTDTDKTSEEAPVEEKTSVRIRYATDEEMAKAQAKLEAAKQNPSESPYNPSKTTSAKAFEEVAKPRILQHKGHRVHYMEVEDSEGNKTSRPMTADEHYDFHMNSANTAYAKNDLKNGDYFTDEALFWFGESPDWHKDHKN